MKLPTGFQLIGQVVCTKLLPIFLMSLNQTAVGSLSFILLFCNCCFQTITCNCPCFRVCLTMRNGLHTSPELLKLEPNYSHILPGHMQGNICTYTYSLNEEITKSVEWTNDWIIDLLCKMNVRMIALVFGSQDRSDRQSIWWF